MIALDIAATVAVVFAALLTLLWLLTRNPDRDRQLKAVRAENERLRSVLAKAHRDAIRHADVNSVARMLADDLEAAGAALPARKRRNEW